jgi:creatinine amidohydrolase/Fe(II)-dependent formamide hydrolase-like protein
MTAVDPFRGLDGNFYSTGFRAFGTILGHGGDLVAVWEAYEQRAAGRAA